MKTGRNYLVKLTVIILTTVLLSSPIFAFNASGNDTAKTSNGEIPEAAIKSLAMGIRSDNLGLRRSSIYLAGYCEIKELVQTLTEQLVKETDTDTRLLIALAIYKIGDTKAQKAILELANNNVDTGLKKLIRAINNNFQMYPSFTNN